MRFPLSIFIFRQFNQLRPHILEVDGLNPLPPINHYKGVVCSPFLFLGPGAEIGSWFLRERLMNVRVCLGDNQASQRVLPGVLFLGYPLRLLQNYESSRKSSFRASEARPGIQDFKSILDSGFRRNDRANDFCKRLPSECNNSSRNHYKNQIDFSLNFPLDIASNIHTIKLLPNIGQPRC